MNASVSKKRAATDEPEAPAAKRGRPAGTTPKATPATKVKAAVKSAAKGKAGRPKLPESEKKARPVSSGKGRGRPPLPPGEKKEQKPYVPTGKPRGRPKGKKLKKAFGGKKPVAEA